METDVDVIEAQVLKLNAKARMTKQECLILIDETFQFKVQHTFRCKAIPKIIFKVDDEEQQQS